MTNRRSDLEDTQELDLPVRRKKKPQKHDDGRWKLITIIAAAVVAAFVIGLLVAGHGNSESSEAAATARAEKSYARTAEKNADILTADDGRRQSVLIDPDIDDLSTADLEGWYFDYVMESDVSSAVILSDEDSSTGIYTNREKVYRGIDLSKSDSGIYTAVINSAKYVYEPQDDNTLELVSVSETDTDEEEAAASPESTDESSDSSSSSSSKTEQDSSKDTDDTSEEDYDEDDDTATASPSASADSDDDSSDDDDSDTSDEVSEDGRYYVCDDCGEKFVSEEAWLDHVKAEHNSTGSYHIVQESSSSSDDSE